MLRAEKGLANLAYIARWGLTRKGYHGKALHAQIDDLARADVLVWRTIPGLARLLEQRERLVKDVVSSLGSAHPDLARRGPCDDHERRNISRDDRSGCDDAPFAERNPGKDHCARPDPDVVLDHYPS